MSETARVDTKQVRANFSSRARSYDRHALVQKRVVGRLLERLREWGPVEGPVLDVGTGTGRLSQALVKAYPGALPCVTDIAHGMTRLAAASVPEALATDADAQALPFRSGCFTLVCSTSVYQWVNDLPLAFSESSRVLVSGGRFAFALFGERTLFELRESHRLAVAETGSPHPSHVQDFPGEEEVRAALSAAGFGEVLIWSRNEVEEHPDVQHLLHHLKSIGARNAALNRPPGLSSRRVLSRMMALYREFYGRGHSIPATYQVIYGLARRG
jgi:malonyl-CoA O-methyltransferase